jgi:hypothetical protein
MRHALAHRVLLAFVLLVVVSPCGADTPALLTGQKTQSMTIRTINGKTTVTLELLLDKGTSVEVLTTDGDIGDKFHTAMKKRLEDQSKRHRELLKLREEAARKNDGKKVEELTKESLELLKEMKEGLTKTPAVAEGVLKFADKQWRLEGSMRPFEPEGKDKGTKTGTCTIRGSGFEENSKPVIRSGDVTILLTGPAAKPVKGTVRATGTLKLGQNGEATLEAVKVEPEKK